MSDQSTIQRFRDAFSEIKGSAAKPYPWQERLFGAFCNNDLPDCLDIPTGLGKTSVIEIWLLAHLLSEKRPPNRLVYVVNRRTIVDQATAIAEQLSKKLPAAWEKKFGSKTKLHVSALRGALADNREWMQSPHLPAIIVGTVDMIGSRLLFDAYRAGKWSKAMHAGLLGQDSLIVHDEAHLSQPFEELLNWICGRQQSDHSPLPIKVMAMSATGGGDQGEILGLNDEDRSLASVVKKIESKKRLKIHACEKSKLVETLSRLAAQYEGEGESSRRVIIYVTTPKVAKDVYSALKKTYKIEKERIELLTGTIRGYERDLLVNTPTLTHLLNSSRPPKSVYLISTSAGEVGADFDGDHLICDIAPLDSMIQRLGRVNRRGDGDAKIDVLVEIKESAKLSELDQVRLKSAEWLGKLPSITDDPDGRFNANPSALKTLREDNSEAYAAAIPAPPGIITPHDVTLDAWAMTSIHGDWPLAHKLDEYLHGVSEYEPPTTSIAWRDELSLFFPNSAIENPDFDEDERKRQFELWLEIYSLHQRELVSNKSEDVMNLLVARAEKHPDSSFIRLERGKIFVERLRNYVSKFVGGEKTFQQRFYQTIRDQTFILPSEIGGLDIAGMIDPESDDRVKDVADGSDSTPTRIEGVNIPLERSRAWIHFDDEGDAIWRGLGTAKRDISLAERPSDPGSWTQLRGQIQAGEQGRICRRVFKLQATDRLAGVLVFFKLPPKSDGKPTKVNLDAHLKVAGKVAQAICTSLTDSVDAKTMKLAAEWHDLGKRRAAWQASIFNFDPIDLAKSFGKGMDSSKLAGYRHEFGSLIDIVDREKETFKKFDALELDQQDLLLQVIASHHGRGRPHFEQGDFEPEPLDRNLNEFAELISPAAIAQRYAHLQRRFGHWGLAWCESLLMCADHEASRGELPEDVQ